MKKIFSSQDISLVSFYKTILEDHGIAAVVKNYYLMGGSGEIPPSECVPELWIVDDTKISEAKALLVPEKNTAWQCSCGEKIDGQFAQCWKCGKIREKDK